MIDQLYRSDETIDQLHIYIYIGVMKLYDCSFIYIYRSDAL